MKTGVLNHIKFKKLKRVLKLPAYAVAGLLESIWQLTAECADDGHIGKYDNDEIAAYLEWDGDPDSLVEKLVECRWLDRHENGELHVHDWRSHAPKYIQDRLRIREQRSQDVADPGDKKLQDATHARGNADGSEMSENVAINPTQPNPTKPNTPKATSESVKDPPGFDGKDIALIKALDAEWRKGNPKATETKPTMSLRHNAQQRLLEHEHTEIVEVFRWCLTSSHPRAANLRDKGILTIHWMLSDGPKGPWLDEYRALMNAPPSVPLKRELTPDEALAETRRKFANRDLRGCNPRRRVGA